MHDVMQFGSWLPVALFVVTFLLGQPVLRPPTNIKTISTLRKKQNKTKAMKTDQWQCKMHVSLSSEKRHTLTHNKTFMINKDCSYRALILLKILLIKVWRINRDLGKAKEIFQEVIGSENIHWVAHLV